MTYYTNTQGDCAQFLRQYIDGASRRGYAVPSDISVGKRIRGPAAGKDERNKSASFYIFDDCRGGLITDFTTGEQIYIGVERNNASRPSTAPRRSPSAKAAADKARQQAESEKHAESAKKARYVLSQCVATSNHPYAIRKGITTPGSIVRYSPRYKTIVLPVRDAITDEIASLQYIGSDGGKRFMPDGRTKGCYIACTEIADQSLILLCEGFATGRTLATAYPDAMVMAAHSCHNLTPVAELIRQRWPDRQLIICGDDDRANPNNPGRNAAIDAATAVGADLMLPNWPVDAPLTLTDFNDLDCWRRGLLPQS